MTSDHEFVAQWPVLDATVNYSEAIAEAARDLDRLIEEHHVVLLDESTWRVVEHAGMAFIELSAPARRAAQP